ncbi:hypothetical protein U0070_011833 [Myodes glareolus]|uniref:Uncharacterized protein n=1 Tax=Myodes glareolus TaxID=447135 RepID=A0AAW0JZF6_MYOGA
MRKSESKVKRIWIGRPEIKTTQTNPDTLKSVNDQREADAARRKWHFVIYAETESTASPVRCNPARKPSTLGGNRGVVSENTAPTEGCLLRWPRASFSILRPLCSPLRSRTPEQHTQVYFYAAAFPDLRTPEQHTQVVSDLTHFNKSWVVYWCGSEEVREDLALNKPWIYVACGHLEARIIRSRSNDSEGAQMLTLRPRERNNRLTRKVFLEPLGHIAELTENHYLFSVYNVTSGSSWPRNTSKIALSAQWDQMKTGNRIRYMSMRRHWIRIKLGLREEAKGKEEKELGPNTRVEDTL